MDPRDPEPPLEPPCDIGPGDDPNPDALYDRAKEEGWDHLLQ